MDKTSEKVTKDQKRIEAGSKGHEKYMAKLKEDILKNVGTNTTNTTTNNGTNTTNITTNDGTNTTSTTTNDDTKTTYTNTSSSFVHIYEVGAIAVLALGVCIFIIPKLMTNQTTAQPDKSPEKISKIRRKML